MSAPCVRCGQPMPDVAFVCRPEASALAQRLREAFGHLEDAEAVITRQVRYGAGSRGGSDEAPGPDLAAAARLARIENTIGTWTRHVLEERQTTIPAWTLTVGPSCAQGWCGHASCREIRYQPRPSELAHACAWLASEVETWLRMRPEADQAFAELESACDDLARLVDRPAETELVGMCDCGRTLYAVEGRTVIRCPQITCRLLWNVAESRDILRRALDAKAVTAGHAARLAQYLDTDRTQEQIRKLINSWSSRGQLLAEGETEDGEPTFRFGDVAERLARTPRRAAREAEDARMTA